MKHRNHVQGLIAYFDSSGCCYVRNTGTGAKSSTLPQQPRPLSAEEITQRTKVAAFLDSASEDEFTEQLLVPLFDASGNSADNNTATVLNQVLMASAAPTGCATRGSSSRPQNSR